MTSKQTQNGLSDDEEEDLVIHCFIIIPESLKGKSEVVLRAEGSEESLASGNSVELE